MTVLKKPVYAIVVHRRTMMIDRRHLHQQNPRPMNPTDNTREGTERTSLSIDETNKLRASLGLKPLTVESASTADGDAPAKSLNSDENFVHQPAANVFEKERTKKVVEKLAVQKEKRLLQDKFLYVSIDVSEPQLSHLCLLVVPRQRWHQNQQSRPRHG